MTIIKDKKFLVNYTRIAKSFLSTHTAPAGFELIKAEDIGDAYLQAIHHLEKHGWMIGFDGWKIQNIVQVDYTTEPSDIKEVTSCSESGEPKK